MRIFNDLFSHGFNIKRVEISYSLFNYFDFLYELAGASLLFFVFPLFISQTVPDDFHLHSIFELNYPIDLVCIDPIEQLTEGKHIFIFFI